MMYLLGGDYRAPHQSLRSVRIAAPGQYCIGIDANNSNDPGFAITFNTPVEGIPIGLAQDVTSQVSMTLEPFTANRNARDPYWCTIITLANNNLPSDRTDRSTGIPGPIEVLLTNLSSNATLVNPAGTLVGSPYVFIQPSALPPGGQASAQLCFLNPSGAPITFVPEIFSGTLP